MREAFQISGAQVWRVPPKHLLISAWCLLTIVPNICRWMPKSKQVSPTSTEHREKHFDHMDKQKNLAFPWSFANDCQFNVMSPVFENLFVFFGRVVYNGFACIRYELGKDANMKNPNAQPRSGGEWLWSCRRLGLGSALCSWDAWHPWNPAPVAALEVLRLMGRNSQPSNFFLVDSRNRRKTNDKDFKHQVLISGFDPIQEKSTRHKTRSAPKVQTRFTCTFQCHPTTEDLWECLILRSLHVQSNTFNIQQEGWDGRALWPECCWPWLALGRQAPARRWQDRPKWNNCDVSVGCPC